MEFIHPNEEKARRIRNVVRLLSIPILALLAGVLIGKVIRLCTGADVSTAADLTGTDTSAVAPSVTAPAASPTPESAAPKRPTISTADFNRMTRDIQRLQGRFRGQVSVYVKNLENGQEWALNANQMMPSASVIKVPVMVGVFDKISKGKLRLDQTMTLTRDARRAGSGQLKWRKNGEQFTLEEILEEMITVSDNIAQQMLVNAVGINYLQENFPKYGLSVTNITQAGLSVASYTRVENYMTARDIGRLLESIYLGEKFGAEPSRRMLGYMKRVKYKDRLPRYLPDGWTLAHKTGLLRRACHDVGIVYSPMGDYILCVMTFKGPSYRESKKFISKVAAITYVYFNRAAASMATSSPTAVRLKSDS